MFHTTGNWM